MKGSIIQLALAASLAIGASARHGHAHQNIKKHEHAHEMAKRAVVTVTEMAPMVTVYEIDGKIISNEEATEGLNNGEYRVVGETDPTTVSEKVETPSPSSASGGGQFFEQKVQPSTSTTKTSAAAKTSASPTPSPSATKTPVTGSISTPFDSGNVPCSEFPSAWGAVAVDWMNTAGWTGIQKTPNYKIGDLSISLIVTGVKGDTCEPGDFCSYACPTGYQKTQWPSAQGADRESIGGLYCNADGMLELTREDYPVLCEKGVGGVSIQNDLSQQVATCRTDYPGNECMNVPALAAAGATVELTVPDALTYYVWDNNPTTAQYYVNPAGMGVEDACLWVSPTCPDCAGNFSPMNIGAGRDKYGIIYLSIFPNTPSSTAKLDFNIEITGDVTAECSYIDGAFSNGDPTGCTTAISKDGGKAVFRYFK